MTALKDPALLAAVLDAAVRGTIVLLAALAATTLMRRASASARHLVWLAALTALLLLPAARGIVPEWRVLPLPQTPALAAPASDAAVPAALIEEAAPPAAAHPAGTADAAVAPVSAAPPPRAPWGSLGWVGAALLVWALGTALLGLRLAYGVARVWWIERRATELTDEEWVRLTDGLARRLRLGRIVRLLREPAATVPMTWGVFHPVVLLPAEADAWDAERRRVVLAHELAHVRRWDAATQWIAHLALAVFWFNPLVWIAVRRLRQEREHACDDAVLEIGTRAADYAGHLLDIVRKLGSAPGPAAALAMARRSQFEGRLLAILDNAVRRNGVSRTAGLATAAAALVCLLPLAALRPAAAAPPMAAAVPSAGPGAASDVAAEDSPGEPLTVAAADAVVLPPNEASPADPAAKDEAGAAREVAPSEAEVAAELRGAITRGDTFLYADIIREAEQIRSPASRRLVLTGLLEMPDLTPAHVAAIVAATRTMDSDLEKRIVLTRAIDHPAFRASAAMPPALPAALASISSSLEQRVVITGLWEARRWDTPSLTAVLRVAASNRSDIERRTILTGAVEKQDLQGSAREAYLAAARAIGSETERGIALSALLRGGREASRARQASAAPGAGPEAGESRWNSDIELDGTRDGKPCHVVIRAKDVFFGAGRPDVRRIGRGGSLHVERRFDGHTHVVRAVPGEGGRPVFTYTVDGERRPFEGEGRAWMAEMIREYTGG